MKSNRTYLLLENSIYVLIWLIVLAVPIFGYRTDEGLRWTEVWRFWLNVLPFVILFTVNNYVLIPLLLHKKRYGWYGISVALVIALLFIAIPIASRRAAPNEFPFMERPDGSTLPAYGRPPEGRPQADSLFRDSAPASRPPGQGGRINPELRNPDPNRPLNPPFFRPMPIRWGPMLNSWLLAVLLVGFNIAIRLLFKSIDDSRRLKELESQRLWAELNYLKAQVNPHFFMNTLNNIHALIDIDAEKAKDTLIELSKIMRYVLYEADSPFVPLKKEIDFLENYIDLMRIRYPDDMEITTQYPDSAEAITVPPLLLVTFIENAFKHGVSYDSKSYIRSELSIDDDCLTYAVRNSRHSHPRQDPGVGLDNLRKRLELIYGEKYRLTIGLSGNEYRVELIIPIHHDHEMHSH